MKFALLSVTSEENYVKKFVQKMCPPLGFFYIESYLKEKLPSVTVLISTDLEEVIQWKPDVIGISSVTENFRIALKFMEIITNRTSAPLILGGVHITFLPEYLPETCSIGVIGEGEETVLELLGIYLKYEGFKEDKLRHVKGIVYRDSGGNIKINPERPLIDPLDSLPMPGRRFIDPLGITHVISSRGCPYNCVFCSTSKFWRCFRGHSARYVADELKSIMKEISPPHIKFFDDLFIASKKRMRELASFVAEEKISPQWGFSCFARAELMDREMAELLKKMGFTGVAIGVESASPAILEKLKGHSTVGINLKALDLCKEYGFQTTCSFVLGMPGETRKDLQMTYDFILDNEDKITEIEICPIVPFPGTQLWDYAFQRGLVSCTMDWGYLEDYSIFTQYNPHRYIYLNESMSFEEFNKYCEKFLEVYKYFYNKGHIIYEDMFQKGGKK